VTDEGGRPRPLAGSQTLQDEGRKLLAAMYGALRALKFYPLENEVVQQALAELHGITGTILAREGIVELKVVGDFFFLNEARLRLDLRNFSTFGSFARALREHKIGQVVVDRGAQVEEWAPFLLLLLRPADPDQPFETFTEKLSKAPVTRIDVRPEREANQIDFEGEAMEGAKRTYAYSVQMAREVLSDVRIGKAVNVRKVKRAVQSIVDQVLSDEPSIVAMTTLREFDEYTFTHSVNVCIFSVVIGQRIGLEKAHLYELGLGALFHDVGKSRVDEAVLNKAQKLSPAEWEILQEHPTDGLLELFRLHGFQDVPYRQMLIAYEHHMRKAGGYPQNRRSREPGIFSRIVAVADAFDAGTSVRSYQYRPWPPDQVLREMRDKPERGFDPVLVKALITATGVYPVGTLVILDTFELAVVTKANPDPKRAHQPEVKIISDPKGVSLAMPEVVVLDEVDPATGGPRRTVIKTADAVRYGIRVADYVTN
jgi:HD-GYP domain-containing protein (c-di-GMP phosphodiesterase class II)